MEDRGHIIAYTAFPSSTKPFHFVPGPNREYDMSISEDADAHDVWLLMMNGTMQLTQTNSGTYSGMGVAANRPDLAPSFQFTLDFLSSTRAQGQVQRQSYHVRGPLDGQIWPDCLMTFVFQMNRVQ